MSRISLNDGTPGRPLSTEERQHEIIRELVEDRDKLRAQLRAYEGSLPLDEQRELQVQLRQQGNELEELRGEVARLTAERDRFHDDYWTRVAEVERLSRELEDVRKLDATFTHQQLTLWADGWAATLDRLDAPTLTVAGHSSPAFARRAAVEYLEKEKADG